MSWYGYVGPGYSGVFDSYSKIENLVNAFPFSKFRKFSKEEQAWEFVHRNSTKSKLSKLVRYGNTFDNLYVTVRYYIKENAIYYNVCTKKFGEVRLTSSDPNVSIGNNATNIMVKLNNIKLNNDLIISHALAIYHILKIIGGFIDVEIVVPDHSIFYLLTKYTGNKPALARLRTLIENRPGEVSVTLDDWGSEETKEADLELEHK